MNAIREFLYSIRPSSVIKCTVYTLFSVILISFSSSFLYSVGYTGPTPDLILCATIAVAYYEGERVSAIFGMLSGFALEAVGSTGFSILPLFYMMVGCVCALLFLTVLGKNIGAYVLYVIAFLLVRGAISLIYIQFSVPDFVISTALGEVILLESIATLVASPFVFLFAFIISRRLNAPRTVQEGRV